MLSPEPLSERNAPDRPGPGRPREFDVEEAVRDAVEVFRAHGYHGTSVHDLEAGTGLARGSLYKAFHDKRSLFLAALEHYTEGSLKRLGETLMLRGTAREALRATLLGYAARVAEGRCQGCLVTVAAMEMMPGDGEVSAVIARMFRRIQDLFAATIIRGQLAGEFAPGLDERAVARMLLCLIQGLRVLGKTAPSEADVTAMVDCALTVLR
jgi:TetR/AcrR family transcriptional repressor of nem operon